jgi:hypothetical protein
MKQPELTAAETASEILALDTYFAVRDAAEYAHRTEHAAANVPYAAAMKAATCEADRTAARDTATIAYAVAQTKLDAAFAKSTIDFDAASPLTAWRKEMSADGKRRAAASDQAAAHS